MTGSGARKLQSWIESFCEYTSIFPSPDIFRRWAAISVISSVLERKVWLRAFGTETYPNMYIVLCGPPGAGKGIIPHAERFLRSIPEAHIAPSATSPQALTDALNDARRSVARPAYTPKPIIDYNYLTVVAEELGVLLPAYDSLFLNMLQRLYDGHTLEERKRTKDTNIKIAHPQISILAGTTPSYLTSFIPEGAWDQGFTSRTIFVYSGEQQLKNPFTEESEHDHFEMLYRDLIGDLRVIHDYYGKLQFTREAADLFLGWHMSGGPPAPEHSKLTHYIPRRSAHLLKLSMISAIDMGSYPAIEVHHYERALSWLLEAEALMPDIFKSTGSGGDSQVMEETWHFIYAEHARSGKGIPEHAIIRHIAGRVPGYAVLKVFEMMQKSNMIKHAGGEGGFSLWAPVPKSLKS